jgi:hypothetical protein
VPDLDPIESLVARIPQWARHITIRTVNQNAQREITPKDWKRHAGWIVIGGNKLDRGFTVKNLAITYMPRGPGLSHADALQQRGRFFGYKASYLDICRGWFNADTRSGFQEYVTHERALQLSLMDVESEARPLRQWRRQLLLSPNLKPTRKQVISLPTTHRRVLSSDGWFDQRFVFVRSTAEANRTRASEAFKRWREHAAPDPNDPRVDPHVVAEARAADLLPLLVDWETDNDDVDRALGVSLILTTLLDTRPGLRARVLFADGVRDVDDRDRARERTARSADAPLEKREINVFQGRGSAASAFPGDRAFVDDERPTLALFMLDLSGSDRTLVDILVPALAIHVPSDLQTLIMQT